MPSWIIEKERRYDFTEIRNEDDIFIRLNKLIDEHAPCHKRARESMGAKRRLEIRQDSLDRYYSKAPN